MGPEVVILDADQKERGLDWGRECVSIYYITGPELHSPANGRVRGRRFETHGLPVGGLDILRSKINQIVQYSLE